MGSGPGIGLPGNQSESGGQTGGAQDQPIQDPVSSEQAPSVPVTVKESKVRIDLFLGRKGVSEDQVIWHDIDEFADYIKQLRQKGIEVVHYTQLGDSIEYYEARWKEELKKAKMKYSELHDDTGTH